MNSIFDFPGVYEVAIGRTTKIIDNEVGSILNVLNNSGIQTGKLLELGCASALHGVQLAKQGWEVVGLEGSDAMVAGAACRVKCEKVNMRVVKQELSNFTLDENDFDAAIFMYEGFSSLVDQHEIRRHFRQVAKHLKPNGVYIVDIGTHQQDFVLRNPAWNRYCQTIPAGSLEVWYDSLALNWMDGTISLGMNSRIHLGGEVFVTSDQQVSRIYTPWMLQMITRDIPEWDLKGCYSWDNLNPDISNVSHYFAVFQKQLSARTD